VWLKRISGGLKGLRRGKNKTGKRKFDTEKKGFSHRHKSLVREKTEKRRGETN
jgi:hypothetical protein